MGWNTSLLALDAGFEGDAREFLKGLLGVDPGEPEEGTIDDVVASHAGLAVARHDGKLILFGDVVSWWLDSEATVAHVMKRVGAKRAVIFTLVSAMNAYHYEYFEGGRRVCRRSGSAEESDEQGDWGDLAPFE